MQHYIIEKSKLETLVRNSLLLTAIKEGGVDNWDGYEDSIRNFLAHNEVKDFDPLIVPVLKDMKVAVTNVDLSNLYK